MRPRLPIIILLSVLSGLASADTNPRQRTFRKFLVLYGLHKTKKAHQQVS
ncbi:MAG: hypothetical protein WCI11_20535 [Candidatus Methylumidiphilus sp.]